MAEPRKWIPVSADTRLVCVCFLIILGMSPPAKAQDQLLNWSEVGVGHYYINTPAIGDLDGDGELDVVVSASGCASEPCQVASTGIVTVLNHDFVPLPGWPIQTDPSNNLLPPTPPVVADLDADGRAEILVGHGHGFFVLTGRGEVLWQKTADEFFRKRVEVADLDGDGHLEILAPTDQYTGQAKIYIWRVDGAPFPGSPLMLDEFYASPPVVYGQGGRTLLAVGGGNGFMQAEGSLYLFAFDEAEGVFRLRWQQSVGQHPIAQPVFTELEGDGSLAIVGGTYRPSVYVVRAIDGTPVGGWPQPVEGSVFASPAVIDDGGKQRIVALTLDGELRAWDSQGQQLWTLSVPANAIENITLADMDRDGRLDLMLGVKGGVVAVDSQGEVIHHWQVGDSWVTGIQVAELISGQAMIVFGRVDNVTERAKVARFEL